MVRRCYGGPEVLELATLARPVPGDDQVLVRVRAAGVAAVTALQAVRDKGRVVPVVDRTFPFADTAGAIAYVETGCARGKVIVIVEPGPEPVLPDADPAPPDYTGGP